MFIRVSAALALLLSATASLASPEGTEDRYAARINAIREALSNLDGCTHECRVDWCTNPANHDIVESVNRIHYSEGLEECGEHEGGCAAHACGPNFAGGWFNAIEDLRSLPRYAQIQAVRTVGQLRLSRDGAMIQAIGCDGQIAANIRLAETSAL